MTIDRRCVVLVLDGLGIGAMPDVQTVRPSDVGANSLAHALQAAPRDLPTLSALGLHAALADTRVQMPAIRGSWGIGGLTYEGADSYRGHLELMGADTSAITEELFGDSIADYAELLVSHGYAVRRVGRKRTVLVVDDFCCVADSLEADPGLNYNVTGSLQSASFERINEVALLVRARARVNRVIAVGGLAVSLRDIIASVRSRDAVEGVDTPALGVYKTGVSTRHLGFAVPLAGQVHTLAASTGMGVTLIGKAADLLECEDARRVPAVETTAVFDAVEGALHRRASQLVVANVQELDLAGHQHDPAMYTNVLKSCDERLVGILELLGSQDCVIITGDHGNDPSRPTGHTRECVPILFFATGIAPRPIGWRVTLADVGASSATWLGLAPTSRGTSFLAASELPR